MTKNEKIRHGVIRGAAEGYSKFRMEVERCSCGMRIRVAGILGVDEFNRERVEICNHGGRIDIRGERLSMTVLENNQLEVSGRIEEIGFLYGKNK